MIALYSIGTSFVALCCSSFISFSQTLDSATAFSGVNERVRYYRSSFDLRAATLATRGLHLRPEAMMPLIGWPAQHASDVYLIRLAGHTTDPPSISEITSQAWLDETMNGYQIAR